MKSLKEISKIIKKSKSFAIFTHVSPDCDALGSSFGLYLALEKLGKKAQIFVKEEFTLEQKQLFDETKVSRELCKIQDFDFFIMVDGSALNRMGDYGYVFKESKNTIVLDHHVCENFIATYNYIESESSSCCEVILKLLFLMKTKFDKDIATALYAGLSSDTASFRNTNTTAASFFAAYQLCNLGADTSKVNEAQYQSATLKDLEFEKYLLNNFITKGDLAYCCVDQETLKMLNGGKADCSSYSRNLVNIQGIHYSFSLVEAEPNVFSLSMRSKAGYDVRNIAVKLGGGGHICAAGSTFNAENMEQATQMVLNAIDEVFNAKAKK